MPLIMSLEGPRVDRLAQLRGELYASVPRKWWRALRGLIPGGKAAGMRVSDFDPEQLAIGARVELEHTRNPFIAREIAMDHLVEDRDYYRKLRTIHLDGRPLGGFFTPWTFNWPFALGMFAFGLWLGGSNRGRRIVNAIRGR